MCAIHSQETNLRTAGQSVQFLHLPHLNISDLKPNTLKFSAITVIHYISYQNYYCTVHILKLSARFLRAAGGVWSGAAREYSWWCVKWCCERVQLVVREVVLRESAAGGVWCGTARQCSWCCVKWCCERVQLVVCEVVLRESIAGGVWSGAARVQLVVCEVVLRESAAGGAWSGAAKEFSWWCVKWCSETVQLVFCEVVKRESSAGGVWSGAAKECS